MEPSGVAIHPFVTDPVFQELERILVIIQNPDGSWGVGAGLDDRLYPTGWAGFTLGTLQLSLSIKKVETLLSTYIVPQIEEEFQQSRWLHVKKLCGLFLLLPLIFRAKLWKNKRRFLENLDYIFKMLESRNWINLQIASYAAFSCSSIPELKKVSDRARSFLKTRTEIPFQQRAYVSLGYPETLDPYLENQEKFSSKLNELTDEQTAHVLLGLSCRKDLANKELKWAVTKAKEVTIYRLRNRHITEIDRKVTKEFLDLLLLLRTNIPHQELKRRMKHLDSQLFIRDIKSDDSDIIVTTKIPSGRLQEILGKMDIPVICCYLLSSLNIGERNVHLVPEKDYVQVKGYFKQRTFPISRRRLFIYELIPSMLILAGEAFVWYFLYLLFSQLIQGNIPNLIPAEYLPIASILLTLVANASVFGGLLVLTARLLRLLFPELSRAVYERAPKGLKRAARILGGMKDE